VKRLTQGVLVAIVLMEAFSGATTAQQIRERGPGEQVVSVSGMRYVGNVYELSVAYDPGSDAGYFAALIVEARPSGTVLLALQNPNAVLPDRLQGVLGSALAITEVPLGSVSQTVRVPFDPMITQDTRVAVTLVRAGKSYLLADGSVSIEDFSFSTYFRPRVVTNEPPAKGMLAKDFDFTAQSCPGSMIEHCCSGGNGCSQQCVCCQGPSFFCNLITCAAPECLDY